MLHSAKSTLVLRVFGHEFKQRTGGYLWRAEGATLVALSLMKLLQVILGRTWFIHILLRYSHKNHTKTVDLLVAQVESGGSRPLRKILTNTALCIHLQPVYICYHADYSQRTHIKIGFSTRAWVIAAPVLLVMGPWNVQNLSLSTFSFFFRSHLPEFSYSPVSLSLLCPLSLSRFSHLYLHPSLPFFDTIVSLSRSPSHPSYSRPVCTSSFWRLSYFSASFNFVFFLHLSALPSLSVSTLFPAPSLSLWVTPLFLPVHLLLCDHHQHFSLFCFPYSVFRISNLSHFLASAIPPPHIALSFPSAPHCVW